MIQARADSNLLLWYGFNDGGNPLKPQIFLQKGTSPSGIKGRYHGSGVRSTASPSKREKTSAFIQKVLNMDGEKFAVVKHLEPIAKMQQESLVTKPEEPAARIVAPHHEPVSRLQHQHHSLTVKSHESVTRTQHESDTTQRHESDTVINQFETDLPSSASNTITSAQFPTTASTSLTSVAKEVATPSSLAIGSSPITASTTSILRESQNLYEEINWDSQPIVPLEFRGDDEQPQITKDQGNRSSLTGVIQSSLLESDQESDADPFRRINHKEISLESEPEESILSAEDEDDFKVHYVHHGKKAADDEMNPGPDLMLQINELQEAVVAMKGSLREAVANLSLVVEDSSSGREVEEVRRKCEGNSAEILKMMLALRTDFSALRYEVTSIYNRQDVLQKSISLLLEDRRVLANDLSLAGVISQHTRNRLDCFNGVIEVIGTGGHSGSGSHSNDSGVALLLEKSPNTFADDTGTLQSTGNRISDQDSLPEQPSLLVPASVYDYVAGLSQPNVSLTSTNSNSQSSCQGTHSACNNESSLYVKEEGEGRILDIDDAGVVYDSDSSLTIAANKTISLSTCLSQEMRVNDTYVSRGSQTQGSSAEDRKRGVRGAEMSGQSADVNPQTRRRRPLLGVSSTKMYQSSSQYHISSEKEHYRHKHRHFTKNDPREVQRYRLAKELVDTEKKYCRTLWTIQETFAEPLKKAAILSNKDISTLFPEEVYQLYEKHCLLQHQLKERLASWKWQPLIGDILARFTDPRQCEILRIYTSYVNDFPEVLKTFHKLCHTSQPFTEFIKSCLEQPACGGQDLGAFLLTPVQRVPRYILLLKQLLKYTDASHPDYRLINTCLERLRDFLSRLNDAMEHSFRLVHSSLSPTTTSVSGLNDSAVIKYRCGRSPCRSGHSRESPSHSPSSRRNRLARIYQPSSSTEIYRSPQRTCSNVGASPQKSNSHHISASRSASLPRGFLSSSESHDSSGDGGPESSPERTRSRSESASRCLQKTNSAHEATPYHPGAKYLPLTAARSVTNVTTESEQKNSSKWDDLTSSEPLLIDPKTLKKKSPTLTSAHSMQNVATTHKLVTWTDSVDSEDIRAKKKSSIKTSIKNIFTFKKRGPNSRNGRDEPLYWPSSVIMEGAETSPQHQSKQQQPQQSTTPVTAIGDFVDEEGNPCTNV